MARKQANNRASRRSKPRTDAQSAEGPHTYGNVELSRYLDDNLRAHRDEQDDSLLFLLRQRRQKQHGRTLVPQETSTPATSHVHVQVQNHENETPSNSSDDYNDDIFGSTIPIFDRSKQAKDDACEANTVEADVFYTGPLTQWSETERYYSSSNVSVQIIDREPWFAEDMQVGRADCDTLSTGRAVHRRVLELRQLRDYDSKDIHTEWPAATPLARWAPHTTSYRSDPRSQTPSLLEADGALSLRERQWQRNVILSDQIIDSMKQANTWGCRWWEISSDTYADEDIKVVWEGLQNKAKKILG